MKEMGKGDKEIGKRGHGGENKSKAEGNEGNERGEGEESKRCRD